MINRIFVLGASDPEMNAIEILLGQAGQDFVHASVNGRRVSPRDAYAEPTMIMAGSVDPAMVIPSVVVTVECDVQLPEEWRGADVVVVDHHRPGDPGYGLGPDHFVEASSVGQVISLLAQEGVPLPFRHAPVPKSEGAGSIHRAHGHWWVETIPALSGVVYGEQIPTALVMTAAADHCLAAAYAGKCPGVDPEELLLHRASERGEWLARGPGQGRDAARESLCRDPADLDTAEDAAYAWAVAVLAGVHVTRERLRELVRNRARREVLGGVEVLDLRSIGTLPELPTALSLEGLAAIYRMVPPEGARDPRVKVGIIGAGLGTVPGPEPVVAFLGHWAREHGLMGIYGDPARGYAGGYEE